MQSEFQKSGEFGPVTKWTAVVDTPMPETPDGSGYTTEENRKVRYEIRDYCVVVSKVSDKGWSVKRYDASGLEELDMTYYEEEQAAHERAREMVEEVAE